MADSETAGPTMTDSEIDDRLMYFTFLMFFSCFMNFFLASCTLLPALFTYFVVTLTVADAVLKQVTE